jgi:hypothetical protein
MNELEEKYLDLIRPTNFIQTFKNDDDFREWARQGTIEDLNWTIKEFEEDELYEYCSILKQIRDDKAR